MVLVMVVMMVVVVVMVVVQARAGDYLVVHWVGE
jgi:hypothetical protein